MSVTATTGTMEALERADRSADGAPVVTGASAERPSYAFLGVRPCDLRAIAIQDRVLTGGAHRDGGCQERRRGAFLIAAECTEPGATCFCVSMGGGPVRASGRGPHRQWRTHKLGTWHDQFDDEA